MGRARFGDNQSGWSYVLRSDNRRGHQSVLLVGKLLFMRGATCGGLRRRADCPTVWASGAQTLLRDVITGGARRGDEDGGELVALADDGGQVGA